MGTGRGNMVIIGIVLLTFSGIRSQPGQPLRPPSSGSNLDATSFLRAFGYLSNNAGPHSSKPSDPRGRGPTATDATRQALLDFQGFNGLPKTGVLDGATVNLMSAPRCGNPDIEATSLSRRKKRYKHNGSKWNKQVITYKLTINTPQLPRWYVMGTLLEAFKIWSDAANIDFAPATGDNYDIEVKFGKRDHGDRYPFDGPGRVLAHAFSPRAGGDVHFDDDESWTRSTSGRNLMTVATHEIGHSLGMSHSKVRSAIMAPYYKETNGGRLALDPDDLEGILKIYGDRNGNKPSSTTSTTSTTTRPEATTTTTTPTTTTTSPWYPERPTTSERAWWYRPVPTRFQPNPLRPTTIPAWIRNLYTTRPTSTTTTTTATTPSDRYVGPGRPANCPRSSQVDAALSLPYTEDIFTFKGDEFMRVSVNGLERGYPKSIPQRFPGVYWGVDAALAYRNGSGQNVIYIFKGMMVWKFDFNFRPLYSGYREIWREFRGIDIAGIDSAFHWGMNNKTYIFQGERYYRFDKNNLLETGYPQPVSRWGFPRNVRRIDAAISWTANKQFYVFVNDRYYKYDHVARSVAAPLNAPAYPRPISTWWYNCQA